MVETREFFDAFPDAQYKDEQALVPPRATDPGWAHGIMVNGGRQKIRCKYCHKVILGGGISRLKQHLAGERGNVAPCEEVPEEVKLEIQQHLGFKVLEKLKKQKGSKSSSSSLASYSQNKEEGEDDDLGREPNATTSRGANRKRKGKEVDQGTTSNRRKRHKKQEFPTAIPVSQPPTNLNFASQESINYADMAVAKFMYDAGIPFSAANSYAFQQMADAIAAVGTGYKMPSYHSLRGKLLNKSVEETGELCNDIKKSWEVTGCSVMVDRWSDKTGYTILNFVVYCPKGTLFLKSVDASDITNSSEALLGLFDTIVQEVGPKNIVNFVTDTDPSYKTAGRLLMTKYKTFFWNACGSHCIDLMLEEIGKIDEVKEVLLKAKKLTGFIYNRSWVLNLMRKRTCGREIVQLAATKFASDFLTLKTIVSLRDPLSHMFTSNAWTSSSFSKQRAGSEVAEIMVDSHFWSLCDKILKVTKPLLSVLQLTDSEERPCMGYIYDAMEKAKRSIVSAFDNKESQYMPYLKVIDPIWLEEFHSPLHAAGYYLNPSIFYNPSFSSNKVIQKGLLDCIETLEPNLTSQVKITSHISFFEDAVGDFSRPVALRGRDSLAPATWWSLYAADYPELQRFAVRILSQKCSITQCKRNSSMFGNLQKKSRNRLENQRLNDLIFVHFNLHLQQRQSDASKGRSMKDTYDPEAVDANMADWVEDWGAIEADDLSWMDVSVPSERIFLIPKTQKIDYSEDNTDETKGID